MPDPKLEKTIEEIKQICIRDDIAAFVVLSSETHVEYLAHLNPSWSCVIPVDGGVRLKALLVDFESKEKQIEVITNTVGLFAGFCSLLEQWKDNFEGILRELAKRFDLASTLKLDRLGPPKQ